MQALVLALLLATATGQQGGRLYVHTTPGLQILIDGAAVGTTEEGGKLIKDVAAGPHHVSIRTDDGREASFNVNILVGQTSEVNVSPLGFRKLNKGDEDESGILHVTAIPTDSLVEFNGMTRENHDGSDLTFDAIPAGRHAITVTHQGRSVRSQIDVPKSTIVTASVNFDRGFVAITDSKPRPRRLAVNDPNDALRMLNILPQWKTAIRSALPATVSILDAYSEGNAVKVRLRVPSDEMARALLASLDSSSSFSDVRFGSYPHREQTGWVVDFIFYFPAGR